MIEGGELHGIRYELPVASAQVKSAILLAGLYARAQTTVVEPVPTRDHTELLLEQAGVRVTARGRDHGVARRVARARARRDPRRLLLGRAADRRRDALSGSELYVHSVGVNPTRTGLLDVLERMRARITVFNRRRLGREPVADLEARSSSLVATNVEPDEIPRLVDELPLVALAAGLARARP